MPQALRAIADRIEDGWHGSAACILESNGVAQVCVFDGGDGSRGLALIATVGADIAAGSLLEVTH